MMRSVGSPFSGFGIWLFRKGLREEKVQSAVSAARQHVAAIRETGSRGCVAGN
jgi:hypothetical protein